MEERVINMKKNKKLNEMTRRELKRYFDLAKNEIKEWKKFFDEVSKEIKKRKF